MNMFQIRHRYIDTCSMEAALVLLHIYTSIVYDYFVKFTVDVVNMLGLQKAI